MGCCMIKIGVMLVFMSGIVFAGTFANLRQPKQKRELTFHR